MTVSTNFQRLRFRRTKIIATLGPASSAPEIIERLIIAGVNVFRLNMSHGTHDSHRDLFERVREISARLGTHTAILADLCGPKIRTGRFPEGAIELTPGEEVVVTSRNVEGAAGLIPSQYALLHQDALPGYRLLLDDGRLELEVLRVDARDITCRVVHGGELKDNKGINLPNARISAPALTDKDLSDAGFMLDLGVDFLAQSFVRRASDVLVLRDMLARKGGDARIIAKLENHEALNNAGDIIDAADGIMIARGDLGVELQPEEVPVAQDQLVNHARDKRKPVIVATQMLESMMVGLRPTRAEAGDIAHAVRSGVDALMLSGETAAGEHPVEAVQMMDRIARHTESFMWSRGAFSSLYREEGLVRPLELHLAVARSVAQLSRDLAVRGIVVISRGGTSASVVSSARPSSPVLAASANPVTCRRMNLNWGIIPVEVPTDEIERTQQLAAELARDHIGAEPGERILLLRGFNVDPNRHAPSVSVLTV